MKVIKSISLIIAVTILIVFLQANSTLAHQVKIIFDPSPDPRAIGHFLYYGIDETTQNKVDLKEDTEVYVTLIEGKTYQFGATAYDVYNNESVMSDILIYTAKTESSNNPPIVTDPPIDDTPPVDDEPVDDTPPTDDTPVDDTPVDVPPIDDTPVDVPPVDDGEDSPVLDEGESDTGDSGIGDDTPDAIVEDDPVVDDNIVEGDKIYYTPFIQSGIINVNSDVSRVFFNSPMKNPIVVATPTSTNDFTPSTVLVTNVNSEGFDIRIRGWYIQDAGSGYYIHTYGNETVSFVAIEEGAYELPGGIKVEAGKFVGTTSKFMDVTMKSTFRNTPVVITTVSSNNSGINATGRLRNVSENSFQHILMRPTYNNGLGFKEEISYIAIDQFTGQLNGYAIEALITEPIITNKPNQIYYTNAFSNVPVMLADIQTANELDTSNLRYNYSNEEGIELYISRDINTRQYLRKGHKAEVIGYISISTLIDYCSTF